MPSPTIALATSKDEHSVVPTFGKKNYSFATERGYIWEKTLDLVEKRPLLGYGMDTLVYNFPQYSIDKQAKFGNEKSIIDKPHNLYLDILYGSGVIAFLLFVYLFAILLIRYMKSRKISDYLMDAVFFSILAYLLQGIFNDSIPGISGTMWILIGILFNQLKKSSLSPTD